MTSRLALLCALCAVSALGCAPTRPIAARARTISAADPRVVLSNTTRADYAGSAACVGCHADESTSFLASPMHHMTRDIATATVRAPFAGEVFRFKNDSARMTTEAGERFLTLESAEQGTKKFRITRVIGGRHREDYAAIEVGGANSDERVMPVSYVFAERAYRYKGYSVMTPERPGMRPGAVWQRTCIFCHNTEPFLDTVLGAVVGARAPYQGEMVDALLPPDRRARYVVTDADAFRAALSAEMKVLGAPMVTTQPVPEMAGEAIRGIRRKFSAKHLIEVGIGCESCHGGSTEHVARYILRPSFAPVGVIALQPEPDEEKAHAASINRACARCHQVLFTGYPFTWEGGRRADVVPGGSHISSGEARDFLLGACQSKLHCGKCHDPHAANGDAQRAKQEGIVGNALCLPCHEKLGTPDALAAHSHHDPKGAGSVCMDCHMPKKNLSLDMRLSRYHRIGSPNDPIRVERDRPLECALCHADKRVNELVEAMETWWGKKYDRGALTSLYGALNANVLRATLANGKAHEQAVAMDVLGRANDIVSAPLIAAQLTHPYPILRYYAREALRRLIGDFEIDLYTDDELIRRAATTWLAKAKMKPIDVRVRAAQPTTIAED